MDTLDQLEQHVSLLLSAMEALIAENSQLKIQQKEIDSLIAENLAMQKELEQEKLKNRTAQERVDLILQRIKERSELE